AKVARKAGERFDPTDQDIEVTSRMEGDYGTAFGIPSLVAPEDREPVDAREAMRIAAIVEASWAEFDRIAAGASEALRKGPRGGGRDRSKIEEHVNGADAAYANVLGLKHRSDTRAQVEALRAAVLATLREPSDGSPIAGKKWPARYAARRIAWHALDHAWEIEDRSEPG
ncbi:MAG TPA: hypothetical protein VGK16_08320, partial [Candidatus Limnocylindrales bacterium]